MQPMQQKPALGQQFDAPSVMSKKHLSTTERGGERQGKVAVSTK